MRAAAVVAGHAELLEAEMLHHFDLVLRHAAERIIAVIFAPARFSAVAVAAQIGRDHGEILREPRRDEMPVRVRERVAVNQQYRRPAAAVTQIDFDFRVARLNLNILEAFEHGARSLDEERLRYTSAESGAIESRPRRVDKKSCAKISGHPAARINPLDFAGLR